MTDQPAPIPVTAHPRLWLTGDDIPRYRTWATDANPLWRDGFWPLVQRMTADMDAGTVPNEDTGTRGYDSYPTESYAELFAFVSLVHPDEAVRSDYATRARTLLMWAIDQAVQGQAVGVPFRDPEFTVPSSDRLRWWGEAWPLTVDWIYPILTDGGQGVHPGCLRALVAGDGHPGLQPPRAGGPDERPCAARKQAGLPLLGQQLLRLAHPQRGHDGARPGPGGRPERRAGRLARRHHRRAPVHERPAPDAPMPPAAWRPKASSTARRRSRTSCSSCSPCTPRAWTTRRRFGPAGGPGREPVLGPGRSRDSSIRSARNAASCRVSRTYGEVAQPAWYGDGEVYLGPDIDRSPGCPWAL